jgi:tRNA (mo5U34)-methyltransferase
MISPAELQQQVDTLPWYHSIDLGNGVVTPGASQTMIEEGQLPPVRGKSVLDIGAWDGYYSFLAERLGASRVVALDHYVWGVDLHARNAYWEECRASGTFPDQTRDLSDFWRPDLPGRRPFDLAAAALSSKVEPRLADFATADLADLGVFDVVFYLGVLYHMKEPLTCLERLRSMVGEVAVIETQAVHIQHQEHEQLLQFYPGGDLSGDFGNWYVPSISALHSMCRAAGFSSVTTILGPPEPISPTAAPEPTPVPETRGFRARRRRTAVESPPPEPASSAPSGLYRAVVHAFV